MDTVTLKGKKKGKALVRVEEFGPQDDFRLDQSLISSAFKLRLESLEDPLHALEITKKEERKRIRGQREKRGEKRGGRRTAAKLCSLGQGYVSTRLKIFASSPIRHRVGGILQDVDSHTDHTSLFERRKRRRRRIES